MINPHNDYQVYYGELGLTGTEHRLSWKLERPFRPLDIWCWGYDGGTVLTRFSLGPREEDGQLIGELPVALAIPIPFLLPNVLGMLRERPLARRIERARLKRPVHRYNAMDFATASGGREMVLEARGLLTDVVILGLTID